MIKKPELEADDQRMAIPQKPRLDGLPTEAHASLSQRLGLFTSLQSDIIREYREYQEECARKEESLGQVQEALKEARAGNYAHVSLLYEAMRDHKSPRHIRPEDPDLEPPLAPEELHHHLMEAEKQQAAGTLNAGEPFRSPWEEPKEEESRPLNESTTQELLQACVREFKVGNFENLACFYLGRDGAIRVNGGCFRFKNDKPEDLTEMMAQCGISLETLSDWLTEAELQMEGTLEKAQRHRKENTVNKFLWELSPRHLKVLKTVADQVARGELRELVLGSLEYGQTCLYTLDQIGISPLKEAEAVFKERPEVEAAFKAGSSERHAFSTAAKAFKETLRAAMIWEGRLLVHACRRGDLSCFPVHGVGTMDNWLKLDWIISKRGFDYNRETATRSSYQPQRKIRFTITPEEVGTTREECQVFRTSYEEALQRSRGQRLYARPKNSWFRASEPK